eukprot:39100-Prymnesium_polylepis.1
MMCKYLGSCRPGRGCVVLAAALTQGARQPGFSSRPCLLLDDALEAGEAVASFFPWVDVAVLAAWCASAISLARVPTPHGA